VADETQPKQPTIGQSIEQLKDRAEWWENKARQLEDRIIELEGRKDDAAARRREREEAFERQTRAELNHARAQAIRALAKLLPEAVRQAKAKPPRPALLRLILRATR
jgi:hypothetical protein